MQPINNEQRRKVAEELRSESERWRDTFPDATIEEEAFGAAIMSDLMVFVGLDDQSPVHAIYARLADLIDRPTCEMEGHPGARYGRCSHCGAFVRRDAVTDCTGGIPVKYCSNCGAEVER